MRSPRHSTGCSGSGRWVREWRSGSEAVIVTVVLRAKKPVCSGCGARGLKIKEHREQALAVADLGGLRSRDRVPAQTACTARAAGRVRVGAVGQGGLAVHARLRRSHRLAGAADEPDAGRAAAADRVAHGRHDPRAGRRRQARPPPPGRARFIGVDEVSYGAEHKFLTCVADHQAGSIVWATEGRNAASLQAFFAGLTDEQKASIKAVSIDMSAGYEKAIRAEDGVPHAQVVFDPFHVVQLGGKAADQVRRDEYNRPRTLHRPAKGKWIKGTRYSLLKDTAKQTAGQLLKLAEVVLTNKRMYRAFLLYGELRYLYKLPREEAPERLRRGSRGHLAPG